MHCNERICTVCSGELNVNLVAKLIAEHLSARLLNLAVRVLGWLGVALTSVPL